MIWIFWEMTSGIIHVFSTLWFDSGYMSLSGYEAFGRISYVLHVKWTLGDDFGLSPYSTLSLVQQRIHALRQSTTAWDFHGVSP